jgi:hypothetical protein
MLNANRDQQTSEDHPNKKEKESLKWKVIKVFIKIGYFLWQIFKFFSGEE